MKVLYQRFLPFFIISLLFWACSPHEGSGVWQAVEENDLGISKLIVSFEGKAEFTTSQPDNIRWHCFWSIADKKKLALNCTPSNNPEHHQNFQLNINSQGEAELSDDSSVWAKFKRLDENPSLDN